MTSPVPVLLALEGSAAEPALLSALNASAQGLTVVRRCVDLADLVAAATLGIARWAVVSGNLRRLDREAVQRLARSGVDVVAVLDASDEVLERRLLMCGVRGVVVAHPETAQSAVDALVVVVRGAGQAVAESGSPVGLDGKHGQPRGRLAAVWGPVGAPGRTSLATYLAGETALLGVPTLLADADTYGASAAQLLGLLDESPGLAAAARAANAGTLDVLSLAGIARQVAPNLRVLTGIIRADRWAELRSAALSEVWSRARLLAALTIVDCGFGLEQDEELSYDTVAPRRNAATLCTLAEADVLLAVGRADPIGVQRLIRSLPEAQAAAPGATVRVVVNRVRRGPVRGDAGRELTDLIHRHTGIAEVTLVPEDQSAFDAALATGRSLHEVAPKSAARLAIATLARGLVPSEQSRSSRRHLRRRRARSYDR